MKKLAIIFGVLLILVACELEEGSEHLFKTASDTLVQDDSNDLPPLEDEEGGELNCLTEAEEEMDIYEMCWFEVSNTQRGRDLIEAYNEIFRVEFGPFPDHLVARDVTFGELKEGLEEALTPIEVPHSRRHSYDIIPFVEAAGIQRIAWWITSERYRNIQSDYRAAFGRGIQIVYEDGTVFPITIDELEDLVRRSIEDGVDHVREVIGYRDGCPPDAEC